MQRTSRPEYKSPAPPPSSPDSAEIDTDATPTVRVPSAPSPPGSSDDFPLDTIVGLIGIVLTVITLAIGIRKPDVSTPAKAFLSALEVVVLIASVVLFGWGGLVVFLAAGAVAIIVSSIRLYVRHESILVSPAIESGRSKQDMQALYQRLKRAHKALEWLGPIKTAELIRLLAQRARSPAEMEQMAVPLATLLAAFDPVPMPELVEKFDRVLRLTQEPASRSMALADTLTASTQKGATTLMEMLDGLLALYSG